jgi:hypothetical protein
MVLTLVAATRERYQSPGDDGRESQ